MLQISRQFRPAMFGRHASAFALAVIALSATGHASAGRTFDIVPKPVTADAASIARGAGSPRDNSNQWLNRQVAREAASTRQAKLAVARDPRCDVRDTCSAGPVGAVAPVQPAIRAEGEGSGTTIR